MRNEPNGSGSLFNVDGNRWAGYDPTDHDTGDIGAAQTPDPAGTLVFRPGEEKDRLKIPDGLAPTLEQRKNNEMISQEWNGYIF